MKKIITGMLVGCALIPLSQNSFAYQNASLLQNEPVIERSARQDWLIDASQYKAGVYRGRQDNEILLSNGLIRRVFRLDPNGATIAFDNLVTGESVIRGIKPEASLTIDGQHYDVGGLVGQKNYAFLRPEWIDEMKSNPQALQLVGFEIGKPEKRMDWKQVRHHAPDVSWPPKGVALRMDYRLPLVFDSATVRTELLRVEFDGKESLPAGWQEHASKANPRSSFVNEGKAGEIYTPANTCVYVKKDLPAGTRVVATTIEVGTDRSSSWGPGIALVWKNRTIKFNLAPGGCDKERKPAFGVFDGAREHVNLGKGEPDITKPVELRLRLDDGLVHCEARNSGGKWKQYYQVRLGKNAGEPSSVLVGKIGKAGDSNDYTGSKGEIVRLHIIDFAAYGAVDQAKIRQAQQANTDDGVIVSVHYELYDGIPCISKWISVSNGSDKAVTINSFTSEILAAVEYESLVGYQDFPQNLPNIHVETDYAMGGMMWRVANRRAVHWVKDPQFRTQVNYSRKYRCQLEVRPELGPAQTIAPGHKFTSFHAFIMPYDSYDRERNGLAQRRMYRILAPWVTENPIMMHSRRSDWGSVKRCIDQAAEVGFEMVILSFGSGFNIENNSAGYLKRMKQYADYAHSKGIEIGGYSLLASRRVGGGNDVVMPKGKHATFGHCPCLQSQWGINYFKKLYNFYEKTGQNILEHDGSYPGDPCMSTTHPGHKGYDDSRWNQFKMISDFYAWCRGQGVYLNVPDYYFMSGSSKCGMGYREVNWSLPRAQQVIHTRQNIFDGTWTKTPSMGWMFVPLTQYHGGGAAATIEPLDKHIDHYRRMVQSNLAMGVQACYRGPRLYDTPRVRDMLKKQVEWYKKYRDILESDMIHGRRADARDVDWMLHVNPRLKHKGMLVVFNPLKEPVTQTLRVPLYYTGLQSEARISHEGAEPKTAKLARDYSVELSVSLPAEGFTWFVIE